MQHISGPRLVVGHEVVTKRRKEKSVKEARAVTVKKSQGYVCISLSTDFHFLHLCNSVLDLFFCYNLCV